MPQLYPPSTILQTPYGPATVLKPGSKTPTGTPVVPATLQLHTWSLANSVHPLFYTHDGTYKTIDPVLTTGHNVTTVYGRGVIIEEREEEGVVVLMSEWRLAGQSRVKCTWKRCLKATNG